MFKSNTASPSTPKSPAARGAALLDLHRPTARVSINAFGETNPLDPKSGGTILDSTRLNAAEMARRAASRANDGF